MGLSNAYYNRPPYKRVSGLGFTASGKRKILDGKPFEKFFPKPVQVDPYLTKSGTVYDTLDFCSDIIFKTLNDTKLISQLLKRPTLKETCEALFNFFYKHYQYRIDEPGIEQLRRPCRAFHDRFKGIDCDCFCISVSSFLCNLKIFPHYLRMVKMYGRDYFQHIFVVVPKFPDADMSKRENYYVIDPVMDKFDAEPPQINEFKDKKMTMQGMPIQYLNGVETARLGEEFNGLGDGLSGEDPQALYKDYCRRCKMNLVNTRNHIARNPNRVKHIYNVQGLIGAYDQLIGAWDNEATRSAVLERLSGTEENLLQPAFQGLGDILHGSDEELFGLINADLDGLSGLNGKKKQARKAATGTTKKTKKAGVFTKIKNANKAAKTNGKKGILKKIARAAFIKANPAIIPIRAGFLAAMKSNTLRIASRVYWALFSEAEAVKAGVSKSFHRAATKGYNFLKNLFVEKGAGEENALKKAIITGRAAKVAKSLAKKGKLNGIDALMGLDGLGVVVTSATVASAMTFLTAVAAFLTKVMGKKGDSSTEESETGEEVPATNADPVTAISQTDTGPVVRNDGAEKLYNRYVNQSGGGTPAASSESGGDDKGAADDESDQAVKSKSAIIDTTNVITNNGNNGAPISKPITQADTAAALNDEDSKADNTPDKKTSESGKGVAAAVLGIAAIGTIAMVTKNKSDKKETAKEEKKSELHGIAKKAIRKKILKVTLT